jgi:hypothetical protein
MLLRSEVPVAVVVVVVVAAAAAVAGAVGLTAEEVEGTRGAGKGWDCSPAADTGLEEGSSTQALAFLHGFGLLLALVGGQAGGCESQDLTSAGAAGVGEGRRTWQNAARSCAAAE